MARWSLTVLSLCVLLSPGIARADDKLSIHWKIFYIQSIYNKPGTGQGFADKMLAYYISHLPEYDHQIEEMPIQRLFHDMANVQEGAVCCPVKTPLPPDQTAKLLVSENLLSLSPPGIVIRKDDFQTLFGGASDVVLADAVEKKGLRTSWVRGATYDPGIRAVIERNAERPNVTMQASVVGEFQEMLLRGNIDFYVSHAPDFQWQSNRNEAVRGKLAFLPVREARTPVPTHMFCNATPEGRQVIDKVNKIIASPEYRQFRDDLIREFYPPDLVEKYIQLHHP